MGSVVATSSEEEVRNWLELPSDVMSLIFLKLGAIEILTGAQWVCSTWRNLSKDPCLFRSINMLDWLQRLDGKVFRFDVDDVARRMAFEAVDRSCGQLSEFFVGRFATMDLLLYMADRSSSLRRLGFEFCSLVFTHELIKKLPQLEELYFVDSEIDTSTIEAFGRFCPLLKSFCFNPRYYYHIDNSDSEALAVAENMRELRHIKLVGNRLTDNGLRAILDGCPHLESLDLRLCINLTLAGDLERRVSDRNIDFRVSDANEKKKFMDEIYDHYHIPYVDRVYDLDDCWYYD